MGSREVQAQDAAVKHMESTAAEGAGKKRASKAALVDLIEDEGEEEEEEEED